MPVTTVTCTSCNTTLKSPKPLPAGAKVKCPKCATIIIVPGDEAAAPAPAPRPAAVKPPAPKPMPAPAAADPDDFANFTEAADAAPADAAPADAAPADAAPARAAGGSFKDKLKKIPMWGWLVGGGVGLFLLCGCCGGPIGYLAWGYLGGGAVSLANFDKIKTGMSEAEVTGFMGAPSATATAEDAAKAMGLKNAKGLPDTKSLTWKSGDDYITATFLNGKVAGKLCKIGAISKMEGGPPGM